MNVFVTGGAGYLGSICVEELLNRGHRVAVFDNLSLGHSGAVDSRAEFIRGCLSDRAAIQAAFSRFQAQAVIHFAANTLVGESMSNPGKYFQNNVACGLNLLDAVVMAGIRKFVFSSTASVYGMPHRVPITEDFPLQPVNPYGESKLIMEKILGWYQEIHGLECVRFRYFNAAGASARFGEDHRPESHLIPRVLAVALGKTPACEIYGADYPTPDGTCVRDYVHVIDLAQAHILALEPGKKGFFNLGNGAGYSVREVINACERVSGRRIAVVERSRRPGDPAGLVASSENARRELGWKPSLSSLESIVASAWNWHEANPDGYSD